MPRYIDADALKKDIQKSVVFTARKAPSAEMRGAWKIVDRIDAAPTADVRENVRGEWEPFAVRTFADNPITNYKCSVCGRRLIGYADPKTVPFCHCGADMRGEKA